MSVSDVQVGIVNENAVLAAIPQIQLDDAVFQVIHREIQVKRNGEPIVCIVGEIRNRVAVPINVSAFIVDADNNQAFADVLLHFAPETKLAIDALLHKMLSGIDFCSETIFINAVAKAKVVSAMSRAAFNDV